MKSRSSTFDFPDFSGIRRCAIMVVQCRGMTGVVIHAAKSCALMWVAKEKLLGGIVLSP